MEMKINVNFKIVMRASPDSPTPRFDKRSRRG